jgi:hypothetical protein
MAEKVKVKLIGDTEITASFWYVYPGEVFEIDGGQLEELKVLYGDVFEVVGGDAAPVVTVNAAGMDPNKVVTTVINDKPRRKRK